jgi:transcription elongation GreA/GreB family factor
MSRAFVKETEGADDALPDRPIGPEANFVTERGLTLIESNLDAARAALADANATGDRSLMATASRDLRYWTARRSTAEVRPHPDSADVVTFGSQTTIERADGRLQTWRIVGLDEADPSKGLISYLSPLAQALLGRGPGDTVTAGSGEAEIVSVDV